MLIVFNSFLAHYEYGHIMSKDVFKIPLNSSPFQITPKPTQRMDRALEHSTDINKSIEHFPVYIILTEGEYMKLLFRFREDRWMLARGNGWRTIHTSVTSK